MPTELVHALALAAGVHSFTPAAVTTSTRVDAGGNMPVVHRPKAAALGCDVSLPRPMAVHAANGSLVCAHCAEFRDCGIGRRTQAYIVS